MNVKAADIQVKPKRIIIPVKDSNIFSISDTEREELLFPFFLLIVFLRVARMTSMNTIVLKMMMRKMGNKNTANNGTILLMKQLYWEILS